MSDSPLFSVVIPLYNKADTIARTLRSVAAQTFHDYEVVVVDDGSKDDGAAIVSSFEGLARLRLIPRANAGVSVARNNGVKAAAGKYIAFLDADDEWMPGFLSGMKNLLDAHPDARFFGSGYMRDVGRYIYQTRDKGRVYRLSLFAVWPYFQPINSSSVVIEKDLFESAGGYRVGLAFWEDAELWFRVARLAPLYFLASPLSHYCDDSAIKATGKIVKAERGLPHLEAIDEHILAGVASADEKAAGCKTLLKMLTENVLRRRFDLNESYVKILPNIARQIRFHSIFERRGWMMVALPYAVWNALVVRAHLYWWMKRSRR